MPQRQGSTKVQLKGIFVGAKVVRGPDWEWGVQDGGEGKFFAFSVNSKCFKFLSL